MLIPKKTIMSVHEEYIKIKGMNTIIKKKTSHFFEELFIATKNELNEIKNSILAISSIKKK